MTILQLLYRLSGQYAGGSRITVPILGSKTENQELEKIAGHVYNNGTGPKGN